MIFIHLAWLIPIFPVVSFLLIVFLTKRFMGLSALISIAGIFLSFIFSLGIFYEIIANKISMEKPIEYAVQWISVPIRIDAEY